MTRFVFTGDLHLTDRPQDEYRWEIFDSLYNQATPGKPVDTLVILGDVTDKKDEHPSRLLIRIVEKIKKMLRQYARVLVIQGNHDYIDPEYSAMRVLDGMCEGRVQYVWEPALLTYGDVSIVVYPHQHRPNFPKEHLLCEPTFVLMHQCVGGAVANTGQALEGFDLSFFDGAKFGHLLAGDIHVPQKVGPLTYCGSPYPINFGDDHEPRIIVAEPKSNGTYKLRSVPVPSVKKRSLEVETIEELEEALADSCERDFHKVRFTTVPTDVEGFSSDVAKLFASRGLMLNQLIFSKNAVEMPSHKPVSQSDEELFDSYCDGISVTPRKRRVGKELLT